MLPIDSVRSYFDIYGVQSSPQKQAKRDAAPSHRNNGEDTVSFSDEALRLSKNYVQMHTAQKNTTAVDDEIAKTEDKSGESGDQNNTADSPLEAGGGSSSTDEASEEDGNITKIEQQIKELLKKLEDIYASSMPENAKEELAEVVKEQIKALLAQKSTLQQAALQKSLTENAAT